MSEENGALLTSVARMYYLDGMGQNEIAGIFGVSRSTVSRLLTTARERGIVRISVDDYDPRDHELEERLISRFGLRRAIVVRGIDGQATNTRRAVGYFAAPIVAQWIGSHRSVGVAGGRTIGQLVHFIEPQEHDQHMDVVQLMGTIGSTPSSIDASELSRTLARRFNGSFHTINAPAFMDDPKSRDLLLSHSQIRGVWSMLSSLELTLVGIGTLEDSVFAERQILDNGDLDTLRAHGAVGEICGRFFDAYGQECRSPLRDRVIGVELETLRQGQEVVAITTGASRKEAIRAALAGRLIHALVIDDSGAQAVLDDSSGKRFVARHAGTASSG
ncbi:MAG TPA: sugar-binding transcriptional regulator [Thermomicrobiales bacterium]|nr:sugar-binding transcriptional regulator [Thermomicrobiales bacterium]